MILKTLNPFKELIQTSGSPEGKAGDQVAGQSESAENVFAKLLNTEGEALAQMQSKMQINSAVGETSLPEMKDSSEISEKLVSNNQSIKVPTQHKENNTENIEEKILDGEKVFVKENSSNEFLKTFSQNTESNENVSVKESEVLKFLKNKDNNVEGFESVKTIKKESSLDKILNPKGNVQEQLTKISAKISEGKPLTPKETVTLQLAAQNSIGVKKKNKVFEQKFNLDVASNMPVTNRKTHSSKSAHHTYAKGNAFKNHNLIKGPVSSELIENKKMIDQDGISNIHKSADQNISFDVLSQGNTDLNQTDLKSAMKPTIDLSHVNVSSKEQLINEVSNYIERSYVAGQDKLDVVVKHDDLGDFKITAHKLDKSGEVALEIHTKLENGHDFFTQNENELVKTLQNNGIKLSSLKIAQKSEFSLTMESGKSFMGEQTSEHSSSHRGSGNHTDGRGQSSQGSSSRQGQERRRELWQEANQYRQQFAS